MSKELIKVLINGFDIFNDTKYFAENGSQNYLVFQTLRKYFDTSKMKQKPVVMAWKSKALLEESMKPPVRASNRTRLFLSPKICVKFDGSCLKNA